MRAIFGYILIMLHVVAAAQSSVRPTYDKLTRQQYIDLYAHFAVKEMLISGVPASITLAQGILESGDGNSRLAREANNHFGIKCHGVWDGRKYHMDDDAKGECFRAYESVFDSYKDHSEFLSSRDRYASLFNLRITDYKGWAQGLKDAGYATNPKYPALLIKIIEENELDKYDRMKSPPPSIGHHQKPPVQQEKPVVSDASERQIFMRNNVRYVKVQSGDTYKTLEELYEIRKWQVLKYNDKASGALLTPGEIIYLQPKRNSNPQHEYHFVAGGETLKGISQQYGIKLAKLYRYNDLTTGEEPAIGQKVWLRKRKRNEL